jgi:hypothetical protein
VAPATRTSTAVRVLSWVTAAVAAGANTLAGIIAGVAGNVLRGYSRIELIKAPKVPYGLSTLAAAIQLNAMDRNGTPYNANTSDPEVAQLKNSLEDGLPMLRRLYEEHRGLYPYSVLDGNQLPYYMRTGSADTDAYYSWFENTLSSHKSKQPLFARRMVAALTLTVNSAVDQYRAALPTRLDAARQRALYDAFGLSAIGLATPGNTDDWNKIITSPSVDPGVQESLVAETATAARAIADYFNQSSLAVDYAVDWSARHGARALPASEAFARFIEVRVQCIRFHILIRVVSLG